MLTRRLQATAAAIALWCVMGGGAAVAQPSVPPAGFAVGVQTWESASVVSGGWTAWYPDARLVTDPVTVKIGKVLYRMQITVPHFTKKSIVPGVQVTLRRTVRRPGGGAHAWQSYTYTWLSRAVHLTAATDLQEATVRTGVTFQPSRLSLSFAATPQASSQPCRTIDGSVSNLTQTPGQLTVKAISLHTLTSPFFADITTRPLTATLISDPGCRTPFNFNPCPGKYGLVGVKHQGNEAWIADSDKTDSKIYEGVINGDQSEQPLWSGYVDAAVPAGDLTVSHSPTSAHAALSTTGNPFITGSVSFASSAPPDDFSGRMDCVQRGLMHTYRLLEYPGTLTPDATTALVAMFDTKPLHLAKPVRGYLDIVTRWIS